MRNVLDGHVCSEKFQRCLISLCLIFMGALLIMPAVAGQVIPLNGKASRSTLKIVEQHFSSVLRLDLGKQKGFQSVAQIDLVEDFLIDRSKVYYALVDLYQKMAVKDGDTNLTSLGKIALYLERRSPKLRKKSKKSMFRGLFAGREKGVTVSEEPSASRSVTRSVRSAPKSAPTRATRGVAPPSVARSVAPPRGGQVVQGEKSYIQTVFYATNRRETGSVEVTNFYNGERMHNGKMHYGKAEVNIPFTHKKGQLELPWMGYQYLQDEKKHIFTRSLNGLSENGFFSAIKAKPQWRGAQKDILVYVHGFNVDFNEAIMRAGQIAFDFGFAGTPIAFSWPSEGESTSYNSDRADALYSAKYLQRFLEKLSAKNPGRKIHIIAHSMGNQALLHGLRLMAHKKSSKRFASVILAAPDFDAELFTEQVAQEIRSLAQSWTIYASKKDSALWASANYNSVKRLGTPLSVVDGYQIIDASELEVTPWNLAENHSYYATKKVILDDMIKVLKGILPKDRGLVLVGSAWHPNVR